MADRDGAKLLLAKISEGLLQMEKVWADRGYNGKTVGEWIKEQLGWALEIVKPPRRWVRVAADEEPASLRHILRASSSCRGDG